MNTHHKLNYLEFTAPDLEAVKDFYTKAFDWQFTDYGDDYTAFTDGVLDGGFAKMPLKHGGVLPIVYSDNLEKSLEIVKDAGGTIVNDIFSFPGGRRFHFTDPAGNELAVWSEK